VITDQIANTPRLSDDAAAIGAFDCDNAALNR
jgi:hypothetical protein